MSWFLWVLLAIVVALLALAGWDVTQKKHAILRNFPVIGHLRFAFEKIGPELRQYIVAHNNEERPFSRDQRQFIYTSATKQNTYFGFGTDNDLDEEGYLLFRHSAFPAPTPPQEEAEQLPMRKVVGERHNRPGAYTPSSVVNISAMSFGSLSARAIEALNKGAAMANCNHNTGEGGISKHHRHGGALTYQLGTGYFGARNPDGSFSMDRMLASIENTNVEAIELKLSQGAKPGLGGVLPGEKVTAEIAEARGVEIGVTVNSPSSHRSFADIAGLINFVEDIASASGLPVGIKSAVGQRAFWVELAQAMKAQRRGPDFISIDGGEGGTGAAPLPFSDHVSLPFRQGFAEVRHIFELEGIADEMVWYGAGRLGLPGPAMVAFAMGVDGIGVAREPMLAIGCIQAQKCHDGHCPTGVATHHSWLTRGLDPTEKSVRLANYMARLRYEMRRLSNAMGVDHPSQVTPEMVEFRTDANNSEPLSAVFDFRT